MKKYFKTFGKLIILALVLLIADVLMSYILEVSYTSLLDGTDTYYFKSGLFRVLYAMLGFYVVIGGWVYLLAVILYHFSRTTELLHNKFKYIIGIALLFYIFIAGSTFGNPSVLGLYFVVVTVIYYVLVKKQIFGKYIRETALWYVIFLLFFFFYWLSSALQPKMLIQQLIVYIPLALIGQKVYSKLFNHSKPATA